MTWILIVTHYSCHRYGQVHWYCSCHFSILQILSSWIMWTMHTLPWRYQMAWNDDGSLWRWSRTSWRDWSALGAYQTNWRTHYLCLGRCSSMAGKEEIAFNVIVCTYNVHQSRFKVWFVISAPSWRTEWHNSSALLKLNNNCNPRKDTLSLYVDTYIAPLKIHITRFESRLHMEHILPDSGGFL